MKKIFIFVFIILCIFFCFSSVYASEIEPMVELSFGEVRPCNEILGVNLTKIISVLILLLRIFSVIYIIVAGMLAIVPAVVSSDPKELGKAFSKFAKMLVVCVIIGLFPTILNIIGRLFSFDLSCLV